jgi:hypothetical protein
VTIPAEAPAPGLAPAGGLVWHRQWPIRAAVALYIVVASEIRMAVRRHSVPNHEKKR